MTREEEIRNAIDTIIPIRPSEKGRTYEQALMATGLEEGIRWADEHPINMWHDTNEEPIEEKEIIFLNKQDIAYISKRFDGTFSYMLEDFYWEEYVNLLKISKWAYIVDLLPKEELKGKN